MLMASMTNPQRLGIRGKLYDRIPAQADHFDEDGICPECGISPGELHMAGCFLESCPEHPDRPFVACDCVPTF